MLINDEFEGEKEIIRHLLANLPDNFTEANVKLPNAPKKSDNSQGMWLRITVVPLSTVNIVATGCYQRTTGMAVIDVFSKLGKGNHAAHEVARHIKRIFNNSQTDNVRFQECITVATGEDESWYRIQNEVTYTHEGRSNGD